MRGCWPRDHRKLSRTRGGTLLPRQLCGQVRTRTQRSANSSDSHISLFGYQRVSPLWETAGHSTTALTSLTMGPQHWLLTPFQVHFRVGVCAAGVKALDQLTWVLSLGLRLRSSGMLGKLFNIVVPQFPFLYNQDKHSASPK